MKHWPGNTPPPQWSVQDAKARFSELLDATVRDGPQIITRRGAETAVLIPIEEWEKFTKAPGRSVMDILVHDPRRFELDLPPRSSVFGMRDPVDFD